MGLRAERREWKAPRAQPPGGPPAAMPGMVLRALQHTPTAALLSCAT